MEVKQHSIGKKAWKRAVKLAQKSLRMGNASANRLVDWISSTMIPWCRGHLLSLAVLMAFPLGMAAYHWANSHSKKPVKPDYQADRESPQSFRDTSEPKGEPFEAAEISTVSLAHEPPQLLSVPNETGGPEFAPQPLPIAVDHPAALGSLEPSAYQNWNSPVPAEYQSPTGSAACVWLTGTIEDTGSSRTPIQSASRDPELTTPSRN